jgi:hypothetical protein
MKGPFGRFLARLIVLTSACAAVLPAQGVGPGSAGAVLKVTSEPPGLRVFNDTLLIGTFESAPLPGGMFRFRIFGEDPGLWASPAIFDSVMLVAGETVERHIVFPRFVRVSSEPPGAEVRLGDSLLGVTPLFALLPRGAVTLTLSRGGAPDRHVLVPEGMAGCHEVMTPPDPAARAGALVTTDETHSTPVIIAVSAAVVSGAASAYLKTRADTYYDDYRVSGDRGTLDRVRRYDLFAGIALGVTELSLGYLIMELLSR